MILDDILRDKAIDLVPAKAAATTTDLQQRPLFRAARRPFVEALQRRERAVIAEVKKASPSKGVIRADFDPVAIAKSYARGGATAISVLTEERYFQGHLNYLAAIRAAVDIPLLRKDFLFDPYQLYEARAYGADAILLIVAALEDKRLAELLWLAEELNLAALVEVHDADELQRALAVGARLIGINNRDLRTFHTTLEVSEQLVRQIPSGILVVGESGINSSADVERLERAGIHVFLIGESLMRFPDPGTRLHELLVGNAS